jgi:hypothetical protein
VIVAPGEEFVECVCITRSRTDGVSLGADLGGPSTARVGAPVAPVDNPGNAPGIFGYAAGDQFTDRLPGAGGFGAEYDTHAVRLRIDTMAEVRRVLVAHDGYDVSCLTPLLCGNGAGGRATYMCMVARKEGEEGGKGAVTVLVTNAGVGFLAVQPTSGLDAVAAGVHAGDPVVMYGPGRRYAVTSRGITMCRRDCGKEVGAVFDDDGDEEIWNFDRVAFPADTTPTGAGLYRWPTEDFVHWSEAKALLCVDHGDCICSGAAPVGVDADAGAMDVDTARRLHLVIVTASDMDLVSIPIPNDSPRDACATAMIHKLVYYFDDPDRVI